MKLWQGTLVVALLLTSPVLSACGPSKAELEYQEKLREYEAEQQAQEQKEIDEVRNWCIEAVGIIKSDSSLVDSWNQFRDNFKEVTPYSSYDLIEQQERELYNYMEYWEQLYAKSNTLDCPNACHKAHNALTSYLGKQRPAIKDLVMYFATRNNWYRLQHNEKLVEMHGLRTQFLKEFFTIVDEYDLHVDVAAYLEKTVTTD